MKKKILTVLLVLSMVFVFASCATKPELDIYAAEKNLKGEDYEVDVEEKPDAGIEEALSAYSEDGDDFIYIVKFEDAKLAKKYYKVMEQAHDSEVEALELEIELIECILEKCNDDLDSDEIDDYEDELKDLKKELEEIQKESFFGISGSTIWVGTENAIKDSRD